MADTVQNVAHFVPTGIADQLEELGAEVVVEFDDALSHGPSREDPKKHRSKRLDYWRQLYEKAVGDAEEAEDAVSELSSSFLSAEQIGSKATQYVDDRRLVIWTTPTFADRLFVWFCFDAMRKVDVPANRIATAEPQIPTSAEEEGYFALRDLEVDEIVEGFDNLIYPKEIYAQAGAQLWQTFTEASPRQFAISIAHTEKFFPEIGTIGENYGWMFPVCDGEDAERMQLSAFDELLLGTLTSDDWTTPFEVLGSEFIEQFHFIDDLVVAARLVDWARTNENAPYVEHRDTGDDRLFDRNAYRLTDRGEKLVEEGLDEDDNPPVFEIGDNRIYAGPEPWVKVIEGENWWFDRFDREG